MSNFTFNKKSGFRERIQYWLDNFMSSGGYGIWLLLIIITFASFGVLFLTRYLALLISPDDTIGGVGDQLWRVYMEMADPGNVGEDTGSNYLQKFIGFLTMSAGIILSSSVVALITTQFQSSTDQLQKGKSKVIESGHALILGFNTAKILEALREFHYAFEDDGSVVLILSEEDKSFMDDFLYEHIKSLKPTRVITRSGSPSNIQALERVGVERCRSVIILNSSNEYDSQEKKDLGDSKALKTIMAVVAVMGENGIPPIVVEMRDRRNRELAESINPRRVFALDSSYILSKILAQTSRSPGLAFVYSQLIGYDFDEIYFYKIPNPAQYTFGELQWHFKKTMVLGYRKADGSFYFNPSPDHRPGNDEELIVLAQDYTKIKFHQTPVAAPESLDRTSKNVYPHVESHLIIGWSEKVKTFLDECSQYIIRGSKIDALVAKIEKNMTYEIQKARERYPHVYFNLIEGDVHDEGLFSSLHPYQYDNIVLMAEESENIELIDTKTIARQLKIRQYFAELEKRDFDVKTQRVSEVIDSDNTNLIFSAGVRDFLIPEQFISKLIVQVSEQPMMREIYDYLFSEYGSEIYIKPASLYFARFPLKVSFADCVRAAQSRDEVCLGLRFKAEQDKMEKNCGIYMIPKKKQNFNLMRQDSLIVLSEDET